MKHGGEYALSLWLQWSERLEVSRPANRRRLVSFVLFFVGFGSRSGRSLQTFPQNFVIKFGGNAVFFREVEVPGFLSPVLRVMRRLYVRTCGELDLSGIQSQRGELQQRRGDSVEVPLS